jgi:hypothetical protein
LSRSGTALLLQCKSIMRIGAVQTGLIGARALVSSVRPRAGTAQSEKPRSERRPSHVLLGWRRLDAQLIAQILAASPDRPALVPAEAAQRYRAPPPPPVTRLLGEV